MRHGARVERLRLRVGGERRLAQTIDWALFLEHHRCFLAKLGLLDALLDSTAGGRPKFLTTQWELLVAASSAGAAEARAAMEEVYRLYCYPVYCRRSNQNQPVGVESNPATYFL